MRIPPDIVGKNFGKWTVMEEADPAYYGKEHKPTLRWRCRCHCGNEAIHTRTSLLRAASTSGGCKQCHHVGRRRPETLRNYLFQRYKTEAERRDYPFCLTFDEFDALLKGTCVYCGSPPSQVVKSAWDEFQYQGVDRMDNTKGYTVENSVPCCEICNKMKRTFGPLFFVRHCKKVAARHAHV